MKKFLLFSFFIIVFFQPLTVKAGGEWFQFYEQAISAIEDQNYQKASNLLKKALDQNPKEKSKVRTYGMHFIEYYPHRELGICYYHLGNMAGAQRELQASMAQEPSQRAQDYLKMIVGDVPPPPIVTKKEEAKEKQPRLTPETKPSTDVDMIVGKKTVKLVGERMGVAVLPFVNKGASRDLGEIILDKMITVLFNQGRFRMIERSQLQRIIEEQSLGASGVIDATTAAQFGKGIGVDAIILGSVAATTSGALSIDARVIDTESAAIIVATDVYTGGADPQSVKNAVENLGHKITESLPLVEGYVIRINNSDLTLDVGRVGGIKRGMKCIVYKEGAEIKHPITGEILGKETSVIGEILIVDTFDKHSVARPINGEIFSVGDKFLTK